MAAPASKTTKDLSGKWLLVSLDPFPDNRRHHMRAMAMSGSKRQRVAE